jgi:hypothetical protein
LPAVRRKDPEIRAKTAIRQARPLNNFMSLRGVINLTVARAAANGQNSMLLEGFIGYFRTVRIG